ncbi:MAG: cytochrome c [Gammaproteobacteria bacterium]|nr:cytochrome c [Gammaproteobacteria bacterium]
MSRLFPLLLTVCTATACAQPFGLDDLSGGELFARFCASCHGESGHGNGPVARTLNTVVPDVTRLRERYGEFAADDIRQIIDGRSLVVAHGTRYMPVWGYEFWVEEGADVTAEREARVLIDRIVEYLRTVQE